MKATGQSARVRRLLRRSIHRENGSAGEQEWVGVNSYALAGLFNSYARKAEEVILEASGGMARLIVRDSNVVRHYQEGVRMITQRIPKSIFEPPGPNNVSDEDLQRIQKALAENKTNEAFEAAESQHLYTLALKGVRSRFVYQPFLVKTVAAGRREQFNLSFANAGAIIGIGSIVGDAGVEGLLKWNLPSDVSTRDGFEYGWLKGVPGVEPGPNGQQILTQEYEYGLWSTQLYGNPI